VILKILKKHYEKIILGLCLVIMLGTMFVLFTNVKKIKDKLAKENIYRDPRKTVVVIDTKTLNVDEALQKYELNYMHPLQGKEIVTGSMLAPNCYITCIGKNCNLLLPISADKCPVCGAEQPVDPGPPADPNDQDSDGIPDILEIQKSFLNPTVADDALADQDSDGFSNGDEYRFETDMEDKTSFPPLGVNLQVEKVYHPRLKIQCRRVSATSANKNYWRVTFMVRTLRRGRYVNISKTRAIGKEIADGFILSDIQKEIADNDNTKYVVTIRNGDEVYSLIPGEVAVSKEFVTDLRFVVAGGGTTEMSGRVGTQSRRYRMRKIGSPIIVTIDDPTVVLSDRDTTIDGTSRRDQENKIKEKYIIQDIKYVSDDDFTVRVKLVDTKRQYKEANKEFNLVKFKNNNIQSKSRYSTPNF